jgi:Flp pilus assembly protein TadD
VVVAKAPEVKAAAPVAEAPKPAAVTAAKPAAVPVGLSAEQHEARGRKLAAANDFKGAIAELDEAIRAKPSSATAYNARGYAWLRLRQYAKAAEDFSAAIKLNPKYENAYRNRAAVRRLTGDAKGAAEDERLAGGVR